jgi:general secretion pathway protein D
MKWHIAIAVGLLATLPMVTMAAEEKSADKPGDTSMMSLSELVARVHRKTGKDFILEPSIGAVRISLAGMDLDRIDYPMLLTVLRYNGLVTLADKQVVSILPDRDARQLPSRILTADDPKIGDETLVTRLVQVRNACAAHMVPVLRPLMPQSAHLAAYPPTNTLILTDHADNARRIVELVERIDKTAPGKIDCADFSRSGS